MQMGRREGDLRQVFRDACRRADLVAEEQRLEAEHVVRLAVLFVEGVGGPQHFARRHRASGLVSDLKRCRE